MQSPDTLNSAHEKYLTIFGLSRPPFVSTIDEDTFYEQPACKQCLDLLQHLGKFGEEVLFVEGVLGSGKTTLLKQYRKVSGENVFKSVLDVDTSITQEQLENELAKSFDISKTVDGDTFLELFQNRVESINRKCSSVVLLIDNVHKLPDVFYDYLSGLANILDNDGNKILHLLLFGERQVRSKLSATFSDKLKIISLAQYSLEETGKYLQFRLVSAGYPDQKFGELFDPVSILTIHKLSGGIPARINKLAHNRLIEEADKKSPSPAEKEISYASRKQLVSSGIIAVIIVSVWLYQDEVRNIYLDAKHKYDLLVSRESPDVDIAPSDQGAEQKIQMPGNFGMNSAAVDYSLDAETEIDSMSIETTDIAAVDDSALNKNRSVDEQVLAAVEPDLTQNVVRGDVSTKVGANVIDETPVSLESEDNESGYSRYTDWLLTQSPGQFTIQVFGSDKSRDVEKLIEKHQLDSMEDSVAYFKTLRKNKSWFSVVVGVYPDLNSAKEAARQLPKAISNGAWVRQFKSVHADIRKASPGVKVAAARDDVSLDNSFDIRRESWLLSQDGQSYTLQLFATNKEANINRLIKEYKLAGDVAYYHTQKRGGDWYGLTYGIYQNRNGAREAVKNLPEKLKEAAWIRKFAGIHHDIQKPSP